VVDETNSDSGDERDVDFSQLEVGDDGTIVSADGVPSQGASSADMAQIVAERDDFHDKYLRALADAENIRKRAIKERSELIKYQGEQIVTDLLSVVDDFELAIANSGTELDKFKQGVEMIHKRFLDVLGKWDVRGESAIGQQFDPNRHEALSKIAVADAASGSVVNELKKTFFYKDKLIRPGQVVVAE
jgi:molecular chaperone GrpE